MTRIRKSSRSVPSNTMGSRIAVSRRSMGITQKELADKVGTLRGSIAMWEAGRACPRRPAVLELSKVLKVSPIFLEFGDGEATYHGSEKPFDLAISVIRSNEWTMAEANALKAIIDVQVIA